MATSYTWFDAFPDQITAEDWLEPMGVYRLVQLHTRRLIMNTPVPIDVSLDRLTLI